MKTKITIILFALMVVLNSCGDPEATTDPSTLKLLVSTAWKIKTVTIDDMDQTSLFPDLTVIFTPTEYTVVNGNLVWPSNGTWAFDADDAKIICRDDDVNVNIEEITENRLVLSLDWPVTTLGKMNSISGQYVFTFVTP